MMGLKCLDLFLNLTQPKPGKLHYVTDRARESLRYYNSDSDIDYRIQYTEQIRHPVVFPLGI